MKKWLIASAICTIPIVFFGIANPIIYLIIKSPDHTIRTNIFIWYMAILCVCIAVVATTTLIMVRYSTKIDNIENKERQLDMSNDRLNDLIRHYNNLISQLPKQ